MSYQIKNSTIQFLTEWEFKSAKMYHDSSNFPTIGIGHRIMYRNEKFDGKLLMFDALTDEEINSLLHFDLDTRLNVISTISKHIKGNVLNQNQVDALISFIFNEGTIWNGLANAINSFMPNYSLGKNVIYKKWISYNKSLLKVNAGLINRRHAEADMFFSEYKGRSYYEKAHNQNGEIIDSY